MNKALPKFIRLPGDPQISPPYSFSNVSIQSFRLKADTTTLQKLVDRQLNIGTEAARGFTYDTNRDYVDLEVLTYGRMESDAKKPEGKIGSMTQHELYFRILVDKRVIDPEGASKSKETAIFIPYIFVDNNWSVIAGREVIGYPKVYAKFEEPFAGGNGKPADPGYPWYTWTIATDVFHKFGAPKLELLEFVKIEAKEGNRSEVSGTWPWVGDPSPQDSLVLGQSSTHKPTIQLKQILDAENHDNDGGPNDEFACYQALVHADLDVTVERTGDNPDPLPPAKITITHHDSLPIARVLGLLEGGLTPISEYRVKCSSMSLKNTRNLFVLPPPPGL